MLTTTLISTHRNRTKWLLESLVSWKQFYMPIIVVDFRDEGCERVADQLTPLPDNVTLIETKYEYRWHKSVALNLALSQVKTEHFMQVDCDIHLPTDFFERNYIEPKCVVNGYRIGLASNSGFVWCSTADALAVGGYNEDLYAWGYEDDDFLFRLLNNGNTAIKVTGVQHNAHKHVRRVTENFYGATDDNAERYKRAAYTCNIDVAKIRKWDKTIPCTKWQLTELAPNHYLAIRTFT